MVSTQVLTQTAEPSSVGESEVESSVGSGGGNAVNVETIDAGGRADIERPARSARSKLQIMDEMSVNVRWEVSPVAECLHKFLMGHAPDEGQVRHDADGTKVIYEVHERWGATLRKFARLRRHVSERTASKAKAELVRHGLLESRPTRLGLRWYVIVPERAIETGKRDRKAELANLRERRRRATGTHTCADPGTQPCADPGTHTCACAQTDHETDHKTDHHHQKPPPRRGARRGGAGGGGGGGESMTDGKATKPAQAETDAPVTVDLLLAEMGFADGKVPADRKPEVLTALIERQPARGYVPADHARVVGLAERIASRIDADGLGASETASTLDGLLRGLRPADRSGDALEALMKHGMIGRWRSRAVEIVEMHPPGLVLNAVKVARWCCPEIGPALLSEHLRAGRIESICGRTQAGQTVMLTTSGEIRRADGVPIYSA